MRFGEIVEDLRPYPGRDWMVVRIVLAAMLAALFVMTFRIPNGWLSLYLCFVFAKPGLRQTLLLGTAVILVTLPVVFLALALVKYTAEPAWLRLLTLCGVLYGAFFVSKIMTNGDIVRNLTILFATVLTFPDVYPYPSLWVEGTLWLFPVVLFGVGSIMLVTLMIPPDNVWDEAHHPPSLGYAFLPDWKHNPEHRIYALKCTFAAMVTYSIYTSLQFQEIQTALMTCLILALPETGQMLHKMSLRITGAAIGAALALIAAIWVIPLSNSIGIFLLVVGGGSGLSAWVSLGSPRTSYAGRQMALAQFMLITHAFGPTTDLEVLRDRLLGIMLGNFMMGVTFKYLWPEGEKSVALQRATAVLCISVLALVLTGCKTTENLAPESSERPWRSSVADEYRMSSKMYRTSSQPYDPDHEYTLSELVDMAQRNNPVTRIAWEQARAAAARVGVAQSAYYPELNLIAAAGYEHVSFPIPQSIFPQGYFYTDSVIVRPEVQVNWLLWDFGRRKAVEDSAREISVAQNFTFNATHQKLVSDVCRTYYQLANLRSELTVLEAALEDAKLIERATQSALEQGIATQTELLQARQQVAQYTYEVAAMQGELRKVQIRLSQVVGLDPGQVLKVQDLMALPLPENMKTTVEEWISQALTNRPDLLAQVADLRAAEADVRQADAQSKPQVAIRGNVGPLYNEFNPDGLGWVSSRDMVYGGLLVFEWPLFDGGRTESLRIAAKARKREMEARLEDTRQNVIAEVWNAYIDFENAWQQLQAAEALLTASRASQEATLLSFEQGLATLPELQTQQALLIRARERYQQARTDIFLSASLLQLAAGKLTE